jgi:hypothetical protein
VEITEGRPGTQGGALNGGGCGRDQRWGRRHAWGNADQLTAARGDALATGAGTGLLRTFSNGCLIDNTVIGAVLDGIGPSGAAAAAAVRGLLDGTAVSPGCKDGSTSIHGAVFTARKWESAASHCCSVRIEKKRCWV